MAYKIIDIEGIGDVYAAKLNEAEERVVEELQQQTGIPVEVAQGGMTIEL